MESYTRVIPRDLFNEAKLLKCIGQLVLLIHDCKGPDGLTFDHDGEPFNIDLMDEGYLTVTNIDFVLRGEGLLFIAQYNSKSAYPLYLYHGYCETLVFKEDGSFTFEFIEFCNNLNIV